MNKEEVYDGDFNKYMQIENAKNQEVNQEGYVYYLIKDN